MRPKTPCGCWPRAPRRSSGSATPPSPAIRWCPTLRANSAVSNPDVRLELTYLTSPVQRDKILQDEIDLGFIEGSFQSSEIESRPVAHHRLMALLPPSHPLAAKSCADHRGAGPPAAGDGHPGGMADVAPHRRRRVPERRTGADGRAGGVEPDRHPRPGHGRRRHHHLLRHAALLRRERDRAAADRHRPARDRGDASRLAAHQPQRRHAPLHRDEPEGLPRATCRPERQRGPFASKGKRRDGKLGEPQDADPQPQRDDRPA